MTGITTTFNPVNDGIVLVVFIVGIIAASRTRIPRQTIKDLQAHVAAQDLIIADLKEARVQDAAKIGKLEGLLQSYKELPFASFKDLADGMERVSQSNDAILEEVKTSNAAILEELKAGARVALATQNDGGILVKTKDSKPLKVKVRS
jgi:hypothetical protein